MKRPEDHGERALDNALPWARIGETPHNKQGELNKVIVKLSKSHKSRVINDSKIQHVFELEEKALAAREKTKLSLLEKTRRIEYEANKTEQTELENKFRALHGLAPKEDKAKQDSTDIQSNEDEDETEQYDDPSYDAILVEAAYILSELNDQMTVE